MGKYSSQDCINNYSHPTFKQHDSLGMSTIGKLIIDNFCCEFDPGCEVLNKTPLSK